MEATQTARWRSPDQNEPSARAIENNQIMAFFFVMSYHLFSTTGSQLPLTSDDGTSDQNIVLKLFDRAFESAE